jgi:hypothetical protein
MKIRSIVIDCHQNFISRSAKYSVVTNNFQLYHRSKALALSKIDWQSQDWNVLGFIDRMEFPFYFHPGILIWRKVADWLPSKNRILRYLCGSFKSIIPEKRTRSLSCSSDSDWCLFISPSKVMNFGWHFDQSAINSRAKITWYHIMSMFFNFTLIIISVSLAWAW